MKYTRVLKQYGTIINGKDLLTRATGKFYTPAFVAERLAERLIAHLIIKPELEISLIDPFCGDGRLVSYFLKAFHNANGKQLNKCKFQISIWDRDNEAVKKAEKAIKQTLAELQLKGTVRIYIGDSFTHFANNVSSFTCVITNPPWEAIKPDRRELIHFDDNDKSAYISGLREYDKLLSVCCPYSQPSVKFAGWGTNLSRCGFELAIKLTAEEGLCGIVLPSSLLMDQTSARLRQFFLENNIILDIAIYPAECRLFDKVDQDVTTLLLKKRQPSKSYKVDLVEFDRAACPKMQTKFKVRIKDLIDINYCVPVLFNEYHLLMLKKWRSLPQIADLEKDDDNKLRLGRELDETNYKSFVVHNGSTRFIKGRMIDRYRLLDEEILFVNQHLKRMPASTQNQRIVWRDVSRKSQARRIIAAIIPPSNVTGNSLNIAYFDKEDSLKLRGLLVIFNSIPFEYQIRFQLGTGHVSQGIIRKIHIPIINNPSFMKLLSDLLSDFEAGDLNAEISMEVFVAIAYGLTKTEYKKILDQFPDMPRWYTLQLLYHPAWSVLDLKISMADKYVELCNAMLLLTKPRIPNHYSARLSELDLIVAKAVPPGGNWKNIPDTVPSQRLVNIRQSFENGQGSRSTYYGRLLPDKPAYTINTYFSRPGNGCHLHYDYSGGQHRVISQREAARFQTFPDNFIFLGGHSDINTQIGNAVPPLLAYIIAKSLCVTGQFIDLFCGAGGLGLGFKWAGWQPIVSNDVVQSFLATYSHNVHKNIIEGDVRDASIREQIIAEAKDARRRNPNLPLFILGGPPCQGFSTAGNYRTMDDERNRLFYSFKDIIERIKPDGFLFENVTGLLNMQKGDIFNLIKGELSSTIDLVTHWVLSADNYAIPQRRSRVFILGTSRKDCVMTIPTVITPTEALSLYDERNTVVTVSDAISDLPKLKHGEDGSNRDYNMPAETAYQQFMRGELTAYEYLATICPKRCKLLSQTQNLHADISHLPTSC